MKNIKETWEILDNWYKQNTPKIAEELKPGVTDEEIKNFEEKIGRTLPADFVESYKIHNGGTYLFSYEYLDLDCILDKWERNIDEKMLDLMEVDVGFIQNVYWHAGWIPFMEDSGGNYICIDLAPAEKGVIGQIINWERGYGPELSEYKSFTEWFEAYKDGVLSGSKYKVDSEGGLEEL